MEWVLILWLGDAGVEVKPAASKATAAPARLRCAIYTRKSTEEGLEQEFNTLDAQREACEAYVQSQKHLGWVCSPERYDDGGFTGANLDRPAMQRLMADFARIIETSEKNEISSAAPPLSTNISGDRHIVSGYRMPS